VTDPKRLLAIIRRVRTAGYPVTEEDYILHVVGAGVPVIGPCGSWQHTAAAPQLNIRGVPIRSSR
jgi:hypothetical protein